MKKNLLLVSILLYINANLASAHDPTLHVNTKWKECSFQLDPSLTQKEWHQFTKEGGLVTYFRSLTDARPIGVGQFELSILQWNTRIDESIGAWNNTFVHPNEEHWLIGGDELPFPGLMLKTGITQKIDAGAYWSVRPGANYGLFGAQVQYNFVNDSARHWAASTRISFNNLYGPEDLNLTSYGLDLLASKDFALYSHWLSVSPYAGVSTFLSHSHEKSDVVNLNDENIFGVRGLVGAVAHISIVRLGVEYNLATVNSLCYKVGVNFKLKSKNK